MEYRFQCLGFDGNVWVIRKWKWKTDKSPTSSLEIYAWHTHPAILVRIHELLLPIQFYHKFNSIYWIQLWHIFTKANVAFCNISNVLSFDWQASFMRRSPIGDPNEWERFILMLVSHPQSICSRCSRSENTLVKLLTKLQHSSAHFLYTCTEHRRIRTHTEWGAEKRGRDAPTYD